MSQILFLVQWLPYPMNNGSKLRLVGQLSGLAAQHQVTLLSFADDPSLESIPAELNAICREVRVVPWKAFVPSGLRARVGYLSWTPRSIYDTYSTAMERLVRQTLAEIKFDLVIAAEITMAGYLPIVQDVPTMFENAELGTLTDQWQNAQTARERMRHALTLAKSRRYFSFLLRRVCACTVTSERERELVKRCAPQDKRVEVMPNFINLAEYQKTSDLPQENKLVFAGSLTYFANYDAMVWFLQDIYPRIQEQIPNVALSITGNHANLSLPPSTNVRLEGLVEDVRPVISAARVSVAPIRLGGGTRLKILEGMALQTPVVATTKAAEGLNVRHGEHLLIADHPQEFAAHVISLLQNPAMRERLVRNAYQRVSEQYDSAVVMPRWLNLIADLLHSPTPAATSQPVPINP